MQNLPKDARLRSRDRIGELFTHGCSGNSATVLAKALPNPDGATRTAFAAGKRLGGAVTRNRLKRRLRACYRVQKDALPGGVDLVLVAKRGLAEAAWDTVMRDMAKAVGQAVREVSGPRPPAPNR